MVGKVNHGADERFFRKSAVLVRRGHFTVKLAESGEELNQALNLRYRVFKLERGKLGGGVEPEQLESDEFDAYCLHLLVIDEAAGRVVGTYRLLSGASAQQRGGFYSEQEYEFDGLNRIASEAIELGRSCVLAEYRNGTAVALLWEGFAELCRRSMFRYLFGCVSLDDDQLELGWQLDTTFRTLQLRTDVVAARPRPEFALPRSEVELPSFSESELRRALPPLFKGYLHLGARLMGGPAWDREFGSIDFPILFDLERLPGKYARHFRTTGEVMG